MSSLTRWSAATVLTTVAVLFGPAVHRASAGLIFSLSFDNGLTATPGGDPVTASGVTFVPGVVGNAGFFAPGSVLTYSSAGNINSSIGTLEFFLIPNWNGNDGQNHAFLTWGGGGGMFFEKDAANNLRGIFRRFGVGGPEVQPFSTPFNVSSWKAGDTHYLVYTWDDSVKVLNFYLDGELGATASYTGTLPAISATTFQIGGDNGPGNLDGALDELQIHDNVLSATEISQRFAEITGVPEPASIILFGLGAVGASLVMRRRRADRHI
jgi:hypothetical protein